MGGYVGAWLSDVLLCAFGITAYGFPFMLVYAAWLPLQKHDDDVDNVSGKKLFFFGSPKLLFILRAIGFIFILATTSGLLALSTKGSSLSFGPGGILGNLVQEQMVSIFNVVGGNLILFALFLTSVTLFTGLSWLLVIDIVGVGTIKFINFVKDKKAQFKLEDETNEGVKILSKGNKNVIVSTIKDAFSASKTLIGQPAPRKEGSNNRAAKNKNKCAS